MAKKYALTDDQYNDLEKKLDLKGEEAYAITVQRYRGKALYGVHVFERQPSTKELVTYEDTASRLKYKANGAQLEGSALLAAVNLYKRLIVRAYDIQVGTRNYETLDASEAVRLVPDIQKREAVREFLGVVSSLTSLTSDDDDERDSQLIADE